MANPPAEDQSGRRSAAGEAASTAPASGPERDEGDRPPAGSTRDQAAARGATEPARPEREPGLPATAPAEGPPRSQSEVPPESELEAPPEPGPVAPGLPPAVPALRATRTGGIWVAVIVAAVMMIFLLVFILQNLTTVTVNLLGFSWSMPLGVAMLFAAIAGAMLVALVGTARILQLRRFARRAAAADRDYRAAIGRAGASSGRLARSHRQP